MYVDDHLMDNETVITGLANADDVEVIIQLSSRVQTALTASGSLQEIGPLQHDIVSSAIASQRCFVLKGTNYIIGCAFIRPLQEDYFPPSPDFNIRSYPTPWLYLHSIMLDPEVQGKGFGVQLLNSVVQHIAPSGGTMFLDCWAGSTKLRDFYASAGCTFVAMLPEYDYEIAVFIRALRDEVHED